MDVQFKYSLSAEEQSLLAEFYGSLTFATIEQHPAWLQSGIFSGTYCFFIARENRKIVCSAIMKEQQKNIFRYAEIEFGPLFTEPDVLIESIKEIYHFYKRKGMVFCSIQLAFPTGAVSEYVEYMLNKELSIKYRFDRENWSSIGVDLLKNEEEIYRAFSKGHKSDIKKAEKNGLSVSDQMTGAEMEKFIEIYIRMYEERSLPVNEGETHRFFKNTYRIIKDSNIGKLIAVKNETGDMIGGVVLIYQGNTVRYFKGAANPAFRHLPVLHLAIWAGIKAARMEGYKLFDLWGYNHFVDKDDQVYYINRFKKGFGGEFIFYPKKMYFIYRPLFFSLYKQMKQMYKRIRAGNQSKIQ